MALHRRAQAATLSGRARRWGRPPRL